jgi:hypothetical protein
MPRDVPVSLRRWLTTARDWRGTELGPVAAWPPVLLTAVASCLPLGTITILWGPRLLRVYGPDYAPLAGDLHPGILGQPAADSWPEAWASMAPYVEELHRTSDVVIAHDVATRRDAHGFDERTYADVTYTPISDHVTGDVLGIAIRTRDTTAEVLGRARADSLARLGRVSVSRRSAPSTARRAIAAASIARDDIADLAMILRPRRTSRAVGAAGVNRSGRTTVEASPERTPGFLVLTERVQACLADGCKQLGAGCRFETLTSPTPEGISDARERALPSWSDGTKAAAECRKLSGLGGADDIGRMVIALDPAVRHDDAQRAFLAKTTEHVSRILTDARTGDADREQVENLQKALETNRTVGAAMGVLIVLRRIQPEEAFDLLRQASQATNRKLRDISEEVLLTGTLPHDG